MERGYDLDPATAASALRWWADAGVDVLVDEAPRDWLRPKQRPAGAAPTLPVVDALPNQLALFQDYLRTSDALPLHAPGAPRICPSGDPASDLMVMIDMPAADDCAAGALIAGEAGQLFDRMLAAIGRDRGSIYLAALSCFRSPSGGLATGIANQCAALARHHIGLAQPKAVLVLGDACAKALLGQAVAGSRGRWHSIATQAGPVKALATLSPDTLLRTPRFKAHAWADLQMLMREFGS